MKREYEYNKMQILRELNFLGAKNKMSYKRRMNNSVKKNLVYQMIYQGFMMVTPFLTVPYLAEVFGPGNIGQVSFVNNIVNYFVMFVALGIGTYGNREIAYIRNDKEKTAHTFIDIFFVHFLWGTVILAGYILFCLITEKNRILYMISCISVLSAILDISWFYAGMEAFRVTIWRNVLMRLLSIAAIFLLVHSEGDLIVYLGINVGSTFAGQLLTWCALPGYIPLVKPDFHQMWKHVRPLLILFIPIIALNVYHQMDKTIIGLLSQEEELGYYTYAQSLTAVPVSLFGVVSTVFMPRLTNMTECHKEKEAKALLQTMYRIHVFVGVGAFWGILGIADIFVVLFLGESFEGSAVLMKYLAATIPVIGISNVIGNGYLLPLKKDKIWIWSLVAGGMVNMAADIVSIPIFGAAGAAWGTVLAEGAVLAIQFYFCRRDLSWNRPGREMLFCIVAGVLMYISIRRILSLGDGWAVLIVACLTGSALYSLMCMLLVLYEKGREEGGGRTWRKK